MTEMVQLQAQGYYYQEAEEAAARARTHRQNSSRLPRLSHSSTALHYTQELHRQQQAQLRRAQQEAEALEMQRRSEQEETEYLRQLAAFHQQQAQAQHHQQHQQHLQHQQHQQHSIQQTYYLTEPSHHHLSAQPSPTHQHFTHMAGEQASVLGPAGGDHHLQLGGYHQPAQLPLPRSPLDPQYQMAQQQPAFLVEQQQQQIKYEEASVPIHGLAHTHTQMLLLE